MELATQPGILMSVIALLGFSFEAHPTAFGLLDSPFGFN